VNFFPPIESVSRRQSVDDCVSVVNARRIVNHCKITEQLDQRYCIKFCQKLDDTQVKIIRKIQQAFRDDAMSIIQIKEWYNRFKDGSTSVNSEPHHGRLSTSRNNNVINQVRTLLMQDRCITVRELADKGGGKHWIGTYRFDCGFGLEESVREIRAKAANDGAEAASPGNRTRHAGLRRK